MALATSRSSVFDQGSVEVNPFTVNTSDRSSPPTQLFIVAPVEENTYPVLLFCHGFCINNTWYSQLLQHISSHGYIVVAPQFYHCMLVSITKEIEIAAKVTDWLSTGLPQVLKEKVKPDLSKLALSGHSRGGKVAFALASGHAPTSLEFSAILGIDPVDGWSPSSRPEPKILTYVPHSFNLEIPIGIIGMGLGDQWKGVIPPFAPDGVNHAEFFNESKPPCCYFLAKEYGHCDMLDESKAYLASWVCKSGEGSKEDIRRAVGGIVVAFFNAYLGDESKDLNAIFKKPSLTYSSSLSSIIVDVNMESNVCKYGDPVQMKTSWTNWNPGRRFLTCPRLQDVSECNFFDWYDPPMCDRSREIIPGFLRVRREMEAELNTLHARSRGSWKTWILRFICGVFVKWVCA